MIKSLRRALIRRINFDLGKELNGVRFKVPIIGGLGAGLRRDHEPWMLQTLRAVERQSDGCFFDVGVNLGQTMLAAKSLRPDWKYIGFEPNPYCVFYVLKLIEANDLQGCEVFPFGIGASTGAMDLHLNSVTGGEASIVEGFRPTADYRSSIKVPIIGGEYLPASLLEQKVGVLKVDVEGGELDVFRALVPVLEKDRPLIISELLPVYDAGTEQGRFRQDRQDALLQILAGLDYRILRLHLDGSRELLDGIEQHGDMAWTNYLFVPGRRVDDFLEG